MTAVFLVSRQNGGKPLISIAAFGCGFLIPGSVFSLQRPSKHSQAILHTDVVSGSRRSEVPTTTSNDDCQYVKLDEKTLPDGTKMKFYAHKDSGPTFDEIMEDIYELASEALVRKLSR